MSESMSDPQAPRITQEIAKLTEGDDSPRLLIPVARVESMLVALLGEIADEQARTRAERIAADLAFESEQKFKRQLIDALAAQDRAEARCKALEAALVHIRARAARVVTQEGWGDRQVELFARGIRGRVDAALISPGDPTRSTDQELREATVEFVDLCEGAFQPYDLRQASLDRLKALLIQATDSPAYRSAMAHHMAERLALDEQLASARAEIVRLRAAVEQFSQRDGATADLLLAYDAEEAAIRSSWPPDPVICRNYHVSNATKNGHFWPAPCPICGADAAQCSWWAANPQGPTVVEAR